MKSNYQAYIFDLNGTMVNDMPYHIKAWHAQILSMGGQLSLEEMKHQCYGKNEELLERIFPGRFSLAERIQIGNNKEALYRVEFKPYLQLIAGLDAFLAQTKFAQIKMAIGSAAIEDNINFVIDNLTIRHYFDAIVSANKVTHSKPHPETFLQCAKLLNISPDQCLVFEDTPKGVECAMHAGMDVVVILGEHQAAEFENFSNVRKYISNYTEL